MKDEDLIIREEKNQTTSKFFASGRVNAVSADVLQYKLENALKNGQTTIILNMSQVEYLSSIGIRVILKIYKQASEAGNQFNIERPSENVRNVLGMTALEEMLVK
ncbi:MAG: STAS domain-containing protein [Treponema sp.]|jgi:anti-anti-sigma factor|nr:STAS domain-containing protein [Treponema sp.]